MLPAAARLPQVLPTIFFGLIPFLTSASTLPWASGTIIRRIFRTLALSGSQHGHRTAAQCVHVSVSPKHGDIRLRDGVRRTAGLG
ncbi:hypothetical protein QBC32DRAFT_151014 [Pseudoneurospora amorphoporcata]|uniref:Uncharacterized protein n=1 Tax=Pseudoneurospora amorphoporcata TaxID=241081 RepID=A0AAN6NVW1_9PEZI|nr:hypothetical protein QBC32DRAFT_151014 [Pseudoneurospora amorphoporcata]